MLNSTQKDLLHSTLQDHISVIEESKLINPTLKRICLGKVITEDCIKLIQFLDKLFIPGLDPAQHEERIELIRSLKFINDLYFNNQVVFSEYGLKSAAEVFFGRLGDIVQKDIQEEIYNLLYRSAKGMEQGQNKNRLYSEMGRENYRFQGRAGKSAWRQELNLPLDQQRIELAGRRNNWFLDAQEERQEENPNRPSVSM